jgi:hypothetical protein
MVCDAGGTALKTKKLLREALAKATAAELTMQTASAT